ncbi:hypothetical protein BGZ46_006973 [Entomortierella lignicola]|nr:hypothetical protein BGZ46_006973 [Entomortierella lignicola]
MSINSLVNLPETRYQVSISLRLQDFVRCIRVCKSWYESFLPYIWGELTIQHPLPTNIHLHYQLINTLVLEILPESFYIQYPNLRILRIGHQWGPYKLSRPEGDPTNLITLNPSISEISIFPSEERMYSSKILQAASELLDLQKLEIYKTRIAAVEEIEAFWRACGRLKELQISKVKFSKDIHIPEDLTQFRIRILKILKVSGVPEKTQLELISRCPVLEVLEWETETQPSLVIKEFIQLIGSGMWMKLKKLRLSANMSDEEVETILTGMKGAIKLDFSHAVFGPRTCSALENHYDSLVELNLKDCYRVSSTTFRDVLCSCPRLEVLTGKKLLANDIAEGGPWACLSLKSFHVYVEFQQSEHHDKDLQSLVFERFSHLLKLEELYVGKDTSALSNSDNYGLSFRLEYGMNQLANLRKLRYFSLRSTIQSFDEEDIKWMTTNWTKLEMVSGQLHSDLKMNVDLRKLLVARNIDGY